MGLGDDRGLWKMGVSVVGFPERERLVVPEVTTRFYYCFLYYTKDDSIFVFFLKVCRESSLFLGSRLPSDSWKSMSEMGRKKKKIRTSACTERNPLRAVHGSPGVVLSVSLPQLSGMIVSSKGRVVELYECRGYTCSKSRLKFPAKRVKIQYINQNLLRTEGRKRKKSRLGKFSCIKKSDIYSILYNTIMGGKPPSQLCRH